jgi:ferredoxin
MTSDDRMTWSFIIDVIDVLERHGYRQHDARHAGQAVGVIGDLARVYEGRLDAPFRTYLRHVPQSSYPQPGPPGPEADQVAVVLPVAEVRTVLSALEEAAGINRGLSLTCSSCPDQSCSACHVSVHAARTYDRLAAHLAQSADAARAAHPGQPEPASPIPPQPAADREAGQ